MLEPLVNKANVLIALDHLQEATKLLNKAS